MRLSIRRAGSLVSLIVLLVSLLPMTNAQFVSAAEGEGQPAADLVWVPTREELAMSTLLSLSLEDDGPWVVRAYYSDYQMVRDLAAWAEPWEVNRDGGYVVVDVDRDAYARLLAMGFRVEIDTRLTAQLRQPNVLLPGQVTGIPGYPCYRTVEETFTTAQNIVATYPALAEWIDVGDSWEKVTPGGNAGYDLMVLQLTNKAVPGPKPKLFLSSSIHAREYAPVELNTRFAEYLVANYGVDADVTWLLDEHEIHLLLVANPDGRKQAETGLSWRKNTNENYCSSTSNYRGADLNRNFEFQWGCCGGSSGDPCDILYRGPSAASEPETQTVQNYVRSQFPDQRDDDLTAAAPVTATGIFLDVHSYGELVLWPWGFTSTPAPNSTVLQTLGRKFAYFNGYEPDQAVGLYPTDGTTDDFGYGELGLAAYTFEVGTAFFQSCSVFENSIVPDNMPALLYAAKAARTPYMTPAGPDPLDVVVSPAGAMPGDVVLLSATIDDTRFSAVNGSEPTQPIAGAEYYIDVPPWDGGATPHAMIAVDGAFDETVEAVTATLDTTGLSEGRHIVYVRGQDDDGNWGVVSAAFLFVADPATSPVIAGYVRDATNRMPLEATVTAGAFQANTDPATGYYSMTVISGMYDVTAMAAGYAMSMTSGVVAADGAQVRQDFALYPSCDIFVDDVESGNAGWTAQGAWAITPEAAHSPTHSWTDSPGGTYGNDWNYALTSPVFDLSGYSGTTLSFWHRYDLENDYDYGYLEYSTDGGSTWVVADAYNGVNQIDWREASVSLPDLDRIAAARFRFRLSTDVSVVEDGWHIDDVTLRGGGPACASEPISPTASFVVDDPVVAGTSAAFTNLSVGTLPMTYHWDFGDGVGTSTDLEPAYTYATSGIFTVTLVATNSLGSDVASHSVVVEGGHGVALSAPVTESIALPGEVVTYTLWLANTGDATDVFSITALGQGWPVALSRANVTLTAETEVTLSVSVHIPIDAPVGARDAVTITVTSQIDAAATDSVRLTTKAACAVVAGPQFSYDPVPPVGGQPVTFVGTVALGSPPITYTWDFGDGSAVQTGAVVTHTYRAETLVLPYTVAMTATNTCGFDIIQRVVEVGPHRIYLPLVIRN